MADDDWQEVSQSVITFAVNLIRNFHPHLQDARICFVFRKDAQKQGDRMILGQASKIPPKMQVYFEYDFLIWLSKEDYERMDSLSIEALIDHELCHCSGNRWLGWKMRPHDIQEFSEIIQRHGVWSPDIMRVKQALSSYETETLPGLMLGAFDKMTGVGKVEALKGANLEKAAQALSD